MIVIVSDVDTDVGEESSQEPIEIRSPSPNIDLIQFKSISTNISISQGRIPRIQGSSKTVKTDLTLDFDEYVDILLAKTKKKLGAKAAMLTVEDLTVKYNWWLGKEPKGIPQLYDLDDEDDFESKYQSMNILSKVCNRKYASQHINWMREAFSYTSWFVPALW